MNQIFKFISDKLGSVAVIGLIFFITSCGERSKFVPYYYAAKPSAAFSFSQLVTSERQMLFPCTAIGRYSKKRTSDFSIFSPHTLKLDTRTFDEAVFLIIKEKGHYSLQAFIPQVPAALVDQGILFWFTSAERSLWERLKKIPEEASLELMMVPYNKRSSVPGTSFLLIQEGAELQAKKTSSTFFNLRIPINDTSCKDFYEIRILPQSPHYGLETHKIGIKEFVRPWDSKEGHASSFQKKPPIAMIIFTDAYGKTTFIAAKIHKAQFSHAPLQVKEDLILTGEFKKAISQEEKGFKPMSFPELLRGAETLKGTVKIFLSS
jgi:hypothetical protein